MYTKRTKRSRARRLRVIEDRSEFRTLVLGNYTTRALQADADTAGGFLVVGGIMTELLQIEQSVSVMRAIGRVLDPLEEFDEIGVPSQEAAMANAQWISELGTADDETTASFGGRVLHPHPIMKRVKVSRKLLRHQANAERWTVEAMGNAVATPQETAFIQGSGSGESWGLLNTDGLPVYSTEAAGALSGDDVRKWLFSLPARFHRRARILTSVDFMRHVLALKDDSGQFLFPDYNGRLLGIPVSLSDGMPTIVDSGDDLVSGAVGAVVGDFSFYWIADNAGVTVQRIEELYAEENEVGFQIVQETDGMAVLANAFYALQISSS